MVHDYHDALPGYHPSQILYDGCGECEARGADVESALAHLDPARFLHAWNRAVLMRFGILTNCSVAEAPLLRVLGAVQLQAARVHILSVMEPLE
jgi:hypothetical protein